MPATQVRNWFDHKKEAPVIMKVQVTNREKQKITVRVSIQGDETTNAIFPKSFFKETFFDTDTKVLCHLQKIDPTKPWGTLTVLVESKLLSTGIPVPPALNFGIGLGSANLRDGNYVQCAHCKKHNDFGMDYCDACGESLQDVS